MMSVRLFALDKSLRSQENHMFSLLTFSHLKYFIDHVSSFSLAYPHRLPFHAYLFIPINNRFRFKQNEANYRNRTHSKRNVYDLMLF